MVRRFRLLFPMLLAGGLATWTMPVAAQPVSDARLAEIFSGLDPGVPVQIVTPSFFVEDAFVTSVSDGGVGVSQQGTSVDIGFTDIRGVSVQSNHWLQGSLWGMGAGVLIGGVTGLMWGSFTCTTPAGCVDDERSGMVSGAAIGGGVGGFAGFMFGRHAVYWRPVFP